MAALATARLRGQSPTDRNCAKRIEKGDTAVIKSVFHVNINVTDFDRSLEKETETLVTLGKEVLGAAKARGQPRADQ